MTGSSDVSPSSKVGLDEASMHKDIKEGSTARLGRRRRERKDHEIDRRRISV